MKTQPINQNKITLFRAKAGAQGVSQKCTQKGVQRGVNAETTWKREHSSPPAKKDISRTGAVILIVAFFTVYHFLVVVPALNPTNLTPELRAQIVAEEEIPIPPPKDLQLEPIDKI